MSKQSRSRLVNLLLIVVPILLVLYIGMKNGDIDDAWKTMLRSEPRWLICCLLSWCVYVLFETLVPHLVLRFARVPIPFGSSLIVSMIGIFYSNVTPGATGGQPMQVYAFKKRGIPSGYSSSALTVKFFCYQAGLLLPAAILWITHAAFAAEHISASRWFIYIGFFVNSLTIVAVILLAINRNIVRAIITLFLNIAKKLRLIKDLPGTASRMDAALNDFHASVQMILHHPLQLLFLILLSSIQVCGLLSILYFAARAVGVDSYSYGQLMTLAYLLFIGASFTPLPGGSGAQEGGFYLFFQNIFPSDRLLGGLLLWRFFNYYLPILLTLLFGVVLDSVRTVRGRLRSVHVEGAEEEKPDGMDSAIEEEPYA